MTFFATIAKIKHIVSRLFIAKHFFTIIAVLFVICFILAGSLVSLHRYWQYDSFYYDFGIFDQALWKVAHFSPPIIDHLVVGGKWIFADHFNPSIFLLSPLYWFTQRREIILIAQATIVGISGFILYLIGIEITKDRFLSLAVLICYFLFVGLQNAVITDFHEVTIQTLPIMLTYFFFLKRKFFLFFLTFIIMLGCKESSFLLGSGIAISLLLIDKKSWKIALAAVIISLLWGFVSIKYIIPYFSGGIYQYSADLPHSPLTLITSFFDHPIKRHTLLYTFSSFGFLPLLSFQFWFLMIEDFLSRFYSPQWFTRFDLGLHYSATIAAIMGVSSLYTISLLKKYIKNGIILNILAYLLILNALFLYRVKLHGPFALAYNPQFYAHTKDFKFLDTLVNKIPSNASVMAQNNLAARFTHQQVWTLSSDLKKYQQKKPDFILLDMRPGQNPNNFFLIENPQFLLNELLHDPNYTVSYRTNEQYIFKRTTANH